MAIGGARVQVVALTPAPVRAEPSPLPVGGDSRFAVARLALLSQRSIPVPQDPCKDCSWTAKRPAWYIASAKGWIASARARDGSHGRALSRHTRTVTVARYLLVVPTRLLEFVDFIKRLGKLSRCEYGIEFVL
eukprot:scaffold123105_cov30-Tisochrysis_lutea.AAC.15